MILQTSLDAQIENVSRIAWHTTGKNAETPEELALGYRKFLAQRRPDGANNVRYALGYEIVAAPETARQLSIVFTSSPATEIDDLKQLEAIEETVADPDQVGLSILNHGLDVLQNICHTHSPLFGLLISDIVVLLSKMANGGSTSNAVGIIWANPSKSWRSLDTVEFLLHEFTHHCMFIDELCNEHYDYQKVLDRNFWTDSAILNRPRPADKVLHSIVVATEILLLREQLLGHPASPRCHPPTTVIIRQTKNAVCNLLSLIERPEASGLLRPRAVELLESCRSHIDSIDVSILEH